MPDYVNKKGKVPALLDSICSGEGEKRGLNIEHNYIVCWGLIRVNKN